ncbi:hypothetical protein [Endozoicomonas sp.]|uniref:hypothetical protein n=1 Tax=Endozoicomonas sp. TaxID=1892382 RepID=UPI00383BDEA3
MEKGMAVLEHRVTELEHTPPRVNSLEHSVNQLEVQFTAMNKDITEIKEEGKETHSLVRQLGEEVRKLFFIGTVVAAIASFLLVGLKVYDTWNGIQDRERSTYTQGSEP